MLIASISKLDWRRPFASKYFRYAGGYLAAKVAIFSLLGLVGQYLLTHKLTVNDYGLLVWVGTIIALLSPFGLPGISNSIAGAVAKGYDGNFRRGTWMEIIGGTLGGLVLLAFAAYYWIWLKDLTKAMIFLVAGVFGPGLWLDTQQCYWNGKRNFRALFWWSVPVRFLQLVATAAVLWYSTSPILVFFANTFIQVIANIGAAVGIIKYGNINNRNSEEFLSYGWVTNHLSILGTITSQIDKVLIGVFFSLEQLAIFAVGEMIYQYFYKLPKSFLDQIFIPRLAEMKLNEAATWVKKRQALIFIALVATLTLVGLAIPTAYNILFSTKYSKSVFYAYLYLANIVVSAPSLLVGATIRAHALKADVVVAQSIISITPLVLMVPFVLIWGLKGVVFARIAQNLVLSGYCYSLLQRWEKA